MNPNRTRDRVSDEMFNHSKVVTSYAHEYSFMIFEPIYLCYSYDSHEKMRFTRAQMETETTEMKTSEAYQRGWLG